MSNGYNNVYTKEVEVRLKAIESALDQIWHMIQNCMSTEQFNRLNVISQRQLQQINSRITTLTTDVTDLQERVDGLS